MFILNMTRELLSELVVGQPVGPVIVPFKR